MEHGAALSLHGQPLEAASPWGDREETVGRHGETVGRQNNDRQYLVWAHVSDLLPPQVSKRGWRDTVKFGRMSATARTL